MISNSACFVSNCCLGNKQLNPTARSEDAQLKLQMGKMEASEILSGGLKKCKVGELSLYQSFNKKQNKQKSGKGGQVKVQTGYRNLKF